MTPKQEAWQKKLFDKVVEVDAQIRDKVYNASDWLDIPITHVIQLAAMWGKLSPTQLEFRDWARKALADLGPEGQAWLDDIDEVIAVQQAEKASAEIRKKLLL